MSELGETDSERFDTTRSVQPQRQPKRQRLQHGFDDDRRVGRKRERVIDDNYFCRSPVSSGPDGTSRLIRDRTHRCRSVGTQNQPASGSSAPFLHPPLQRVRKKQLTLLTRRTAAFIAECHRLLHLVCRASLAGQVRDARTRLELCALFREVDRFEVDFVYFADEAGAWQIGVDWREVLPAWARGVAAGESPDEFAVKVVSAIEEFAREDREVLIEGAMTLASTEQARDARAPALSQGWRGAVLLRRRLRQRKSPRFRGLESGGAGSRMQWAGWRFGGVEWR